MKNSVLLYSLVALTTDAFSPHRSLTRASTTILRAETQKENAPVTKPKPKVKQELGLLTFDLDDTLYPIGPCVEAANGTFGGCFAV